MTEQGNENSVNLPRDRIAQFYLGTAGTSYSQRISRARIDWISEQAAGEWILDIGCSEGILPILLGRNNYHVHGVDINPQAIDFANKLLQEEPPEVQERVRFYCADLFKFQPDRAQYDTVIAGEVIEHFENPEKVVQKALSHLKPGGIIIITTPFGYFPDPDHRQTFTLRSFMRLLEQRCTPRSLEIVDGYIRLIAENTLPGEDQKYWFTDEYLLGLTEQAAIAEQKRYRSILGERINETYSIQRELNQATNELSQAKNELSQAKNELSQTKNELSQTKNELNRANTNLEQVLQDLKQTREHLKYYMNQFNWYRDAFLDIESSVAYRLGNSLKLAVTRPGKNTLLLPVTMARLFADGVKRVVQRRASGAPATVSVTVDQPKIPAARGNTIKLVKKEPVVVNEQPKKQQFTLDPAVQSLRDLRVACIMDTLTFHAYDPECRLKHITPENWRTELETFQPHMLLIESAWQGVDKLWYSQVDRCSPQVQKVVDWCRKNNIPTVFWNKEDPVHFDTFIRTAALFDFIFTTDLDAIRKYKAICKTQNVFLLPFAAQPAVHNPIEKYERKKGFCFAGAYYANYPERQRDFDTFSNVLADPWGLDIYDRNSYPSNPDYMFPERYQRYILGTLPPEKIDQAYKGYRFGINMNSIKQSQTMFARRVFELLASNTVTVSNYSRGVRNLFGDLVICTDNASRLSAEVQKVAGDEVYYRKYRLAGLRRVLREETYHDRLAYIVSKVFTVDMPARLPKVTVFAAAETESQARRVLAAFERQVHQPKRLALALNPHLLEDLKQHASEEVTLLPAGELQQHAVETLAGEGFAAVFSAEDYYGPHYLLDMALATRYTDVDCIGKRAFYQQVDGDVQLIGDGQQYQYGDEAAKRSAMMRIEALRGTSIAALLADADSGRFTSPGQCFAVDEFNYCRDCAGERQPAVEDLVFADPGISSLELMRYAETLPAADTEQVEIKGNLLEKLFGRQQTGNLGVFFREGVLDISSTLPEDKHEYIYAGPWIETDALDITAGSACLLEISGSLDIQLAVIWYNQDRQQMGTTMVSPGKRTAVNQPEDACLARLALRVKGSGHCSVEAIRFGKESEEIADSWVAKSDLLLVSNEYPAYSNLYHNAFVHRRAVGYKNCGMLVDILQVNSYKGEAYDEFQGLDIVTGPAHRLECALASGRYRKVLVHFLTEEMWNVLKKYLDRVKVIIWIHGSEIQPWWRREFNFTTPEEKEQADSASVLRQALWKEVFGADQTNLHYVFVSNYLAQVVAEDYGLSLEKLNNSIIHNFIDTDLFRYQPKPAEQRKRLLSIRPYTSRTYANDITVKTILELSSKPFFSDLEFRIIGDGPLFDETVAPLMNFKNVKLEKRFLTQDEIAALHKEYGLFLTPTRMDTQGVSRDEAMSSGLVPLTNAVAAVPEFVDETCAILAPEEDHLALAAGIEFLYHHPDAFLAMSQAAAERVRRQTAFPHTIAREIELIRG